VAQLCLLARQLRWVRDVDAAFVMVATGDEIRPDTDAEVESLLALD